MLSLSKIFLYFCLAFILGIVLSFLKIQGILFLFTFGIVLSLIFGYCLLKEFWQKQKIRPILLIIIIFFIVFSIFGGWMRYYFVVNPEITSSNLSYFNDYPEKIKIIGVITRTEERKKNNRLVIQVEIIKIGNKEKRVEGKVMAFVPKLIEVSYGDRVKLEGRLKNPPRINRFNWPMHLANDGIHSVIFMPWTTIIEQDQGTFIMNKIHSLNSFLQKRINQFLHYPESAILSAMLLGNRGEIPDEIFHDFRIIGIAHILAISGIHITIIAGMFFWLALSLGMWRQHAFILTSLFLIFFVLMVGAPPSAIRAGIMGFIFLLAQYLGRSYLSLNAIIIAATIMLIFNPLSLFYDIGFQFSFAAILAIALLFPIFQYIVFKKFKNLNQYPILSFFINTILISAAITIFLDPLIVYYFGIYPIVSIIANLFAVPILPFILFFGILFLIISIVFPPLSIIFSSLVYLFIALLIYVGGLFASIPIMEYFQFTVPVYFLIIYYIILFLVIYIYKNRNKEAVHPLYYQL